MNISPKPPAITTVTSREFNQDTSRAKRAAKDGPVFITDRGKLSHVLLSAQEYQNIKARGMSLAETLADPDSEDVEFDPPRLGTALFRGFEFD